MWLQKGNRSDLLVMELFYILTAACQYSGCDILIYFCKIQLPLAKPDKRNAGCLPIIS